MSQRSILSASIQASFPNNTTGFITPTGLRDEQGLFNGYAVLNEQTASIIAQAVATASVGGGVLVTTSSFNAYTASTNTFTSSIQTQVNTLQSVTSSYVNNTQTSSFVNNSQTSSMLAPYVQNSQTSSFATTGSNSFSGSNTFSGSVFIQTASISVLYADKIVSSSTIFSSGSNTLGDASDDTQTLWGTIDIKTGPLKVSGSTDISGSLLVNGSSAVVSNQTGSFATTGANTFTGSQILSSSTTPASLLFNVSGSLTSFVTESGGTTLGFGNIIFNNRTSAIQSGSYTVKGASNILYYAGASATAPQGFIGNNNNGVAPTYSGSVIPNFNNNVAPSTLIVSASSPITIASNFIAGASNTYITNTTATSSFSFNVLNGANIRVNALLSGSSTGTSVGINNNNLGGTNHLIQFEGSSSVARNFSQNIIVGAANTASLTSVAGASITTGSLLNTAILGSNLVVSGTMSNASLSASVFVGQYNETGSLADPSQIKFAVGAGTSNTARKTPFFVRNTGEVVIDADGGGDTGKINSVFGNGFVKIGQNTVNANTTVSANNGTFITNGGTIAAGEGNVMVGGGSNNSITNGRDSGMFSTTYSTINTLSSGAESHNVMVGAQSSVISGSRSRFTGIYSSNNSSISQSIQSAIIAGNFTSLNDTTSSVALGRDTAYTGSASYTLYTQNIQASGSVAITGSFSYNGNRQFNYGEFWMSSSSTPSAGVSQSVVFDSVGHQVGTALSGSGAFIKVTNGGTYNIQFSAQINANAGTDTMWMWFKKNGTNIAASNSKAVLANNTAQLITVNILDTATANDYYEIVYQNNAGHAQILSEAASGNYPSIPGVILTVTQVA